MKVLSNQETLLVSGADDDALFNGLIYGVTAGFFIGTFASMRMIAKYPVVAVIPGGLESTIQVGAVCGACIGGIVGGITAALMDDTF